MGRPSGKTLTGVTAIANVSNDAAESISMQAPYIAEFTLMGSSDMLFKRWSCEDVEEKAKAAKGSAIKKTDNLEVAVWRDDEGHVCLPGEYVRQALIEAAKRKQDPSSPRKSAKDLFKAGIIDLTGLARIEREIQGEKVQLKDWDYVDQRRVKVQMAAITRSRPANSKGWTADFQMEVALPEFISPEHFLEVLNNAGRLIGVGDFRPTFGRFMVTSFKVRQDD